MAATDVLPSSPMTPGLAAPWSSFDDYLDFPSPLPTPRLAPLNASSLAQPSGTTNIFQSNASLQSAQSGGLDASTTASSSSAPPAPGSSPEVLFRYYLAAELRRIGSSADDTIIDKYVAQHYDSFTRAFDRQQSNHKGTGAIETPNVTVMSDIQDGFSQTSTDTASAFRSPPPMAPSSAPYLFNGNGNTAPQSIDPHMMDLSNVQEPFVVSPSAPSVVSSTSRSAASAKGKYRETSTGDDEDEEMSEDEEEDSKDHLADLVSSMKATKTTLPRNKGTTPIEETPIAGSIMGPANELRPDPEAYRKLSSKEKRQLRNKISARNFRTRRKEHIATLEQQVADRDTLIEGLRQQLALVKVQNRDLTEEVRVLKSKSISNADVTRIIEALQKGASTSTSLASAATAAATTTNEMGPPSLLRSSSNSSLSDTLTGGRPGTPASPRSNSPHSFLARPNMRKDLALTSNATSKSFWGGVGGTGNNFMSVHTVLVPHLMQGAAIESCEKPADDKITALTRMVDEKLSVKSDHQDELKSTKASHNGMQESDVNEAIVSLLGNGDVAPPSYSEAIETPPMEQQNEVTNSTPSVINLGDGQIHASIVRALQKAFSAAPSPHTHPKCLEAMPQLDAQKITALLEGRATLVLYDEQKGQLWKGEENSSRPSQQQQMNVTTIST